jgi:hypothetical protein
MKASEVFDGADDAQQEKWEQELVAKHPEAASHVAESKQRMSGWSKEDGSLIQKELAEIEPLIGIAQQIYRANEDIEFLKLILIKY